MGIMKNKWSGKSLPLRKRLEKMKKQELIKLCTELDLASFGSKAELVQKIKVLSNKSESNSSKDLKLDGEDNFAVIEDKKELSENEDKDDSYELKFVKATDTKIKFIDDPTESKNTCGVKIFLPADSPVDFLMRWEKQVRNHLQPRSRRFCGAIMMSITDELGKQLDDGGVWTGGKGVLVCRVLRGSPAHGGGLAPGDCIIEVNGIPVFSLGDIYKELEGKGILDCTVIREGKLKSAVCFEPLDN